MEQLVKGILLLSALGSVAIGLMALIRPLVRRVSLRMCSLLWIPVLVRLLCPWGIPLSVPVLEAAPLSAAEAGAETAYEGTVAAMEKAHLDTSTVLATSDLWPWIFAAWCAGATCVAASALRSWIQTRRAVQNARQIASDVHICSGIRIPFACGFLRPKIYLPEGLSARDAVLIIKHERGHIERRDGILRLAFLAARILHWFNPFVYLADRLAQRDMELACDEHVAANWTTETRARYASALLAFARPSPASGHTMTSFGGGSTKERIERIMIKKKRAGIRSLIACAAAGMLLCSCAAILPSAGGARTTPETMENRGEWDFGYTRAPADGEVSVFLKEYEEYGVHQGEDGRLYYEDQLICNFLDGYYLNNGAGLYNPIGRYAQSNPDGEVDVITVRADTVGESGATELFGPITGMSTHPPGTLQALKGIVQTAPDSTSEETRTAPASGPARPDAKLQEEPA